MARRRILLLGVGNAQLDALTYLKTTEPFKSEWEVHACSYRNEGPGRRVADAFSVIDIADATAVLGYARTNEVSAVYSVGSDVAMPTVALVSSQLGLPCFNPPDVSATGHYKQILRALLGNTAGNLRFCVARSLSDLDNWNVFPCMMKPVDSQGQRGVFRIQDRDELASHIEASRSHSRQNKVIVEEFVSGREVSVSAYVVDGQPAFSLISDRLSFPEYPGGIIDQHHLPSSVDSEVAARLQALVATTIEATGIENGPVYFQVIISKDGPKIIEVTPRLDGCHLWRLIYLHCGVDLLDATLRHLLLGAVPEFNPVFDDRTYSLRFLCEKPGEVMDRGNFSLNGSIDSVWYQGTGSLIPRLNGFMEKVGYVIEEARS